MPYLIVVNMVIMTTMTIIKLKKFSETKMGMASAVLMMILLINDDDDEHDEHSKEDKDDEENENMWRGCALLLLSCQAGI